jgi:signal transduction histidine kinase
MLNELQPDEKLIAQLFDTQPDSVVWFIPLFSYSPGTEKHIVDFEVKYCNAAASKILGVEQRKVVGSHLRTSSLMDDVSRVLIFDQCIAVWEKGESIEFTYYSPGFDKYFNVQRSKVMNGVLSITRDRTLEVKAEKLREDQAKLLDSIFNSSINGVYTLKALRNEKKEIIDFTFAHVNTIFCKMVSKHKSEIVGKRYLELFPDTLPSGVFGRNIHILKDGNPVRQEIHYVGDGVDAWYDSSIVKVDEDTLVISFNDITSLKRSSEHIRQIVDNAQTGICLLSPVLNKDGTIEDFQIALANKQFVAYTGTTPEEIKNKLLSDYFPSYKEKGATFETYCSTYLTGQTNRKDMHYHADGIDVYIDVLTSKMENYVLATINDYTLLKKLQLELEKSNGQLKLSNEKLSEFTQIASHDLNEPLRKINTFTQLLVDKHSHTLEPGAKDYLQKISKTARRMQTLINDLLTYSQINNSVQEFKQVSLKEIVQEVISDLETSIHSANAGIEMDDLPDIRGDKTQLRQIFQNLISNAIKFRSVERTPTVRIISSKVTIGPNNIPQPFYKIEVIDNGIGFEASEADSIFKLFKRLHSKTEYEGTGIGLAIVQKAVENHKGIIMVESEPGKGSTFQLFFPAA